MEPRSRISADLLQPNYSAKYSFFLHSLFTGEWNEKIMAYENIYSKRNSVYTDKFSSRGNSYADKFSKKTPIFMATEAGDYLMTEAGDYLAVQKPYQYSNIFS